MTARPKLPPAVPSLTVASYQGLISRVCDVLKITPNVLGQDRAKHDLEAEALEKWCGERQAETISNGKEPT